MKRLLTITAAAVCVLATASPAHAAKSPSRACLRALDAAEEVVTLSTQFVGDVSSYFRIVGESAGRNSSGGLTGVTTFLREQTTAINDLTAQTDELTPPMTAAASRYEQAAATCRRGR